MLAPHWALTLAQLWASGRPWRRSARFDALPVRLVGDLHGDARRAATPQQAAGGKRWSCAGGVVDQGAARSMRAARLRWQSGDGETLHKIFAARARLRPVRHRVLVKASMCCKNVRPTSANLKPCAVLVMKPFARPARAQMLIRGRRKRSRLDRTASIGIQVLYGSSQYGTISRGRYAVISALSHGRPHASGLS